MLLFSDAVARGDHAVAADLYRGRFLGDFEGRVGRELDLWIASANDQLDVEARRAFEGASLAAREAGDPAAAVGYAQSLADRNPLDTGAVRLLASALAGAGRHHDALKAIRGHETLLRGEDDEELPEALGRHFRRTHASRQPRGLASLCGAASAHR